MGLKEEGEKGMGNIQRHDGAGTASENTDCREPEITGRNRVWWNLKQCCEVKGISVKTAQNHRRLQPNCGRPDAIVGGRRVWRLATVQDWLLQTDDDLTGVLSSTEQASKRRDNDAQNDQRTQHDSEEERA